MLVLLALIAVACNEGGPYTQPSSPGDATDMMNYAQMSDGSLVVSIGGEAYQLNWVLNDWPSYVYGAWIYAEVNQQRGVGLEPGEGQVNVQLQDVQFVFSGLPSAVTEIVAAIKDCTDDDTDSYTAPHQVATDAPGCRFIDNTDGTITDATTALTWQRNANAFGFLQWDNGTGNTPAPDACANLANGAYGLTDGSSAGDWRLPKPSELRGLYDAGIQFGGTTTPFTGVQMDYWGTDTNDPPTYTGVSAGYAWLVVFTLGRVLVSLQASSLYVWCVRG